MEEDNLNIIGVDPGSLITGYAIIAVNPIKKNVKAVDFGVIKPKKSLDIANRYRIIFDELNVIIKNNNPTIMSVETQFVHKNPQSALKIGMARGIAVLAASIHGLNIVEYAPCRAKKAVVGNGSASKEQVFYMITRMLGLEEKKDSLNLDITDAFSLALCAANEYILHGCKKPAFFNK